MCEPRRLTNLWASTACYSDSFTFYSGDYEVVLWDITPSNHVRVNEASDEYIASIFKVVGKAGFILGLFYDTEGECTFLRNAG
jgi:hypothetical protein